MNILIVEDEAIIALDLTMILEDAGAAIAGTCHTVADGLVAADGAIDAAILDVDLHGELVFPVADRLAACGKPFVFHTGRLDKTVLRGRYGGDVPILEKPAMEGEIISALRRVVSRGGAM
ncbi:MAG: response regulator [Jannaschia sp.]